MERYIYLGDIEAWTLDHPEVTCRISDEIGDENWQILSLGWDGVWVSY